MIIRYQSGREHIAQSLGNLSYTLAGGALIGAAEFGLTGFGAAFGETLGSGGSLRDAFKAGAIGGAVGAATGALIEGSYLGGWQSSLHGISVGDLAGRGVLPPVIGSSTGVLPNQVGLPNTATGLSMPGVKDYGWGQYLHGTDLMGAQGIGATRQLRPGSWLTLPNAIDKSTGKLASQLTPSQYRAFMQLPGNKGDYFVDILAPNRSVELQAIKETGAPQWRIYGEHRIKDPYKNPN